MLCAWRFISLFVATCYWWMLLGCANVIHSIHWVIWMIEEYFTLSYADTDTQTQGGTEARMRLIYIYDCTFTLLQMHTHPLSNSHINCHLEFSLKANRHWWWHPRIYETVIKQKKSWSCQLMSPHSPSPHKLVQFLSRVLLTAYILAFYFLLPTPPFPLSPYCSTPRCLLHNNASCTSCVYPPNWGIPHVLSPCHAGWGGGVGVGMGLGVIQGMKILLTWISVYGDVA